LKGVLNGGCQSSVGQSTASESPAKNIVATAFSTEFPPKNHETQAKKIIDFSDRLNGCLTSVLCLS
jgi:hypothetical protein